MPRAYSLGRRGLALKLTQSILPVAAAASLLVRPSSLLAAVDNWDGNTAVGNVGDGVNWSDPNNWTSNSVVDSLPATGVPGDDITFGNGTVGTIHLGANRLSNSITFNANFTLDTPSSTNTLTITSANVSVGSGVSAGIDAIIAPNSGLRLAGAGTLTLTAPNAFNGQVTTNGGTLVIDGSSSYSSITVNSSTGLIDNATMTLGAVCTNNGNFTVSAGKSAFYNTASATFIQQLGTLTINGSFNTNSAGFTYNGGTVVGTVQIGSNTLAPILTIAGAAGNSGTFFIGGEGVTLNGSSGVNIQSNQTLDFIPTATTGVGVNDVMSLSSSLTNAGMINIEGNTTSLATLNAGTNTVTNTGAITTSNSSTVSTSAVLAFLSDVLNNTTGTVALSASTKNTGSITNGGLFSIAAGDTLTLGTSTNTFTQSGGSLTINGTLSLPNNNFSYNGGSITGTVTMGNSSTTPTVTFGSTAVSTGTILVTGSGAVDVGNVPSGVTLTLQPTAATGNLTVAAGFTNNGALNLIGSASSAAEVTAAATLTNSGILTTSNSSPASTLNQFITGTLTNNTGATFNVNASTSVAGKIRQFGATNIASGVVLSLASSIDQFNMSSGAINIAAGGTLDLSENTTFLTGGTITLAPSASTPGVIRLGFVESGGSASASTCSILSGTPTAGQQPGYVDLAGNTVDFAVGNSTGTPLQVSVTAPITNGGLTKSGSGVLEISGNNTYTLGTTVSDGTLVVGAAGAIPSLGGLTVETGGILQLASGIGGPTTQSVSIDSTSDLDITNNHLFINYSGAADPISSIAALISAGFAGGSWTGVGGIISTTAQTNAASYGIGYADSAAAGNPAGLPSRTIEIAYTLLGDANLDGKVNGTDFTLMATHFNQSVTHGWEQGDFDYSNSVNGSDFLLLANNFNQFASQSAVSASDLAALDSFAAANGISLASVPEPATSGICLLAAFSLLHPRFRARRAAIPCRT